MKIKVLIVEDETLISQEIASCLEENEFEISDQCSNALDALNSIKQNSPDVILMDISIKGELNGIDLAKKILNEKKIPIIFLTSNNDKDTIQKATEIRPDAFLLKPFNEQEFPIAIELAFAHHNNAIINKSPVEPVLNDCVFVKNGKRHEKIKVDSILYIEADGSYSKVVTNTQTYLISFNLSHFHEELAHNYFIRIHRSHVVNLKNIDSFDTNYVFINGKALPISKQYQESFSQSVKKI